MIIVILAIWIGGLLGYIMRQNPQPWINKTLGYIISLLLFLMGNKVGHDHELISSISIMGIEALIAAVFTVTGSSMCAFIFLKIIQRDKPKQKETTNIKTGRTRLITQMKDSVMIITFFIIGCITGYYSLIPDIPSDSDYYTLCILMLAVGFTIGQSSETCNSIIKLDRRLLLLPFITITGTLTGIAIAGFIIERYSISEWMSVGSGFGYYSLSGILITKSSGAELGTMALLVNIIREIITLMMAPLLFRIFGVLSPICAGGCTTEDTTLPIITKVCGKEYVPVSIYHGIVLDFAVPLMIGLFTGLKL